MSIFERTKNLADKKGLSLQQLATKAGMGINTIYGWKTKTPSSASIFKIAKVLGVTTDELLGEKKKINSLNDDKIDITDAIHEGKILAYEGKEIPKEEVEMIRRIIEGRKHNG
ncbi:XRE family transcriptional regulator [Bombilactobacillus bombi]|uniref:XRE family transcriptional regulator n=1 Tax=Bombilactobacillus bombi TaxID=1303590 RepID=A0A3R7CLN4_9LACO|nr:helix-turn-helix transcriptional regulator [Bombilactobacillus bombi]RHW48262.1 XRE family transcriptional regulator [Bombilactobacillus bombi]